ncbi:hypothetical protein LTR09_001937 [Extremus antarcticus]|uniref:Glutathione S-transferase n=1 Tax=Extremus antarcticus TaxID=702011 RepID=A0AAJ0GGA9_9PEZI|nr:hypothetical protein LTR09_001937 [Extremus antarcticus]
MPLKLISATPSPYARMNRIAMLEKGIPFELQNEIPWHKSETQTPKYNPLEKLPILLNPDDPNFEPVYDSAHIQDYIVQKYADKAPRLLTGNLDLDLKARQILVLAEGVMDAFVLEFFESARPEEKQSQEWIERQRRKINGGMRAFDELVRSRKGEYLIGDGQTMTIADIAAVCAVGHIDFAGVRSEWSEQYPELCKWYKGMDERANFASTRPVMFDIKTNTVTASEVKATHRLDHRYIVTCTARTS